MRRLALLALVLLSAPAAAQDPGARMDAIFERWNTTDSPGCAVGVVRDGRLLDARAYGMSNLEHGIPITPRSIFHVASISKQFTAMSILLLEREGRLSLDDDIRRYLPEVHDFGRTITIRHLLHHTSGLRDQWQLLSLAGWRPDDPKSEEDILWLVSRQRELNFDPGAEYLYSNTGFTLLGTIVERVTGQSLREFADARIFRPLGMTSTHFHDDHTHMVPGRTAAYVRRGDRWAISIPVFDNAGATSLFTTVEDLAKWDRNFREPVVGDAALLERMHRRGVRNDGDTISYALALMHGEHRGLRTVGHSGSDAGYRADFLRFPETGYSFITLCNTNTNAGQLNRRVAEVFLEDRMEPEPPLTYVDGRRAGDEPPERRPVPPPAAPGVLEQFTGRYYSPELDVTWSVARTGDGMRLQRRRFEDRTLEPAGEDELRGGGWQLRFTRDAAGNIDGFRLTSGRVRNLRFDRLPG